MKTFQRFFSKNPELTRIVYVSRSTIPGSPEEVAEEVQRIVTRAQEHNLANEITGLLLFSGKYFAQVLEGPGPNIQTLFNNIERDTRHTETQMLINHTVNNRAFSNWDMALTMINQEEMADIITLFPANNRAAGKDNLIVSLMQTHLEYYGNMDNT